jgi:hypothetical protein
MVFFPEGYLRMDYYKNEENDKIISEVDKLMTETDFDLERFLTLRKAYKNTDFVGHMNDLMKMPREEQTREKIEEVSHIGSMSKGLMNQMEEMIRPIFDTLIEKGYARKRLMQ